MNAPVTRGELRQELGELEARLEARLEAKLGAKLGAQLETSLAWFMERVIAAIAGSEQRLMAQLGGHSKAGQEALSAQVAVVDEKYRDLPARVERLEHAVHKRTKRAKR